MTWFDDNEDRLVYGRGRSKYGPFDPDEDADLMKPLCCKRCGSTDVRWRQQGGKWTLFSLEPGKLHVCPIEDDFKSEPEQ